MRLDDLVRGRFALHCRGFDFDETVPPDIRRKLDALNVCVVHYAKGSAKAVRDLDGAMDDFFDSQGCAAFVSRPDFYAYGAAASAAAVVELLTEVDVMRFANRSPKRIDVRNFLLKCSF